MKAMRNSVTLPIPDKRPRAPGVRPVRSQRLGTRTISSGMQVIDGVLRRFYDVREFTDDPDCLLRISHQYMHRTVTLDGGTRLAVGDPVIELHLWNEHVPRFPAGGPTVAWAINAEHLVAHSLELLAHEVDVRSDLAGAHALHAVTPFASRHTRRKVLRLADRFGFEVTDLPHPQRWRTRLHQAASNILIAGFVWAYNPASFRLDGIAREYVELWMPITTLAARYGSVIAN